MSIDPNDTKTAWWSPIDLLQLFGRYTRDQRSDSPYNAVQVGREGQRTFILDVLHSRSGVGAYLVTGHRGAGKTSFITNCLREYREDVYSRYLNGRVGRGFLWDRLGLAVLAVAGSVAAVLLFEIISLVMHDADKVAHWIVALPFLFVAALPILYGYRSIAAAAMTAELLQQGTVPWWTHRRVLAPALGLGLTAVCGLLLPLADRPFGLASLVFVGALVVFVAETVTPRWRDDPARGNPDVVNPCLLATRLLVLATAAMGGAYVVWTLKEQGYVLLLLLGVAGLGLAGIWRAGRESSWANRADERGSKRSTTRLLVLGRALGSLLLLGIAAVIWLSSREEYWSSPLFSALIGVFLLGGVWRQGRLASSSDDRHEATAPDWARPIAALLLKSVVAISMGLQLLQVVLHYAVTQLDTSLHGLDLKGSIPSWAILNPNTHVLNAPTDQLEWLLTLVASMIFVYHLEDEWILAGFRRWRQDPASRPHDLGVGQRSVTRRRVAQRQASQTLAWRVLGAWLPVMTVSVNLGADRLPYAAVVRSMLGALRDQYAERFVSIRSGLTTVVVVLVGGFLLVCTNLIGDQLFWPDEPRQWPAKALQKIENGKGCQAAPDKTTDNVEVPPAVRIACSSADNDAAARAEASRWLQLAYIDLLDLRGEGAGDSDHEGLLLCSLLACETTLTASVEDEMPGAKKTVMFRVYHLAIFVLLLVATRVLSWLFPILPYRRNLSTLDAILDRLLSKRTLAAPGALSSVAAAANAMLGRTQLQYKELDPEDARTVEASFVAVIDSLQSNRVLLPGGGGRALSLPAPELIFVFDELDKVGSRGGASLPLGDETVNPERARALALVQLLSEMKSLLSSTPARFLFVGGRNLHDEWIADHTSRLPLLSSVFKAEVYLPSLLADLPRSGRDNADWLTRIEQYVDAESRRAAHEHDTAHAGAFAPRVLRRAPSHHSATFAPLLDAKAYDPSTQLYSTDDGTALSGRLYIELRGETVGERERSGSADDSADACAQVTKALLRFLAYRSIGNPKRLRDLLERLVRPTARLVGTPSKTCVASRAGTGLARKDPAQLVDDAEHALNLTDRMRYRTQLLSEIYGALASSFENRYPDRDDKLAVALFNLADFLFRFHGRAFSWSNLERVEELVHVHRAHDHRLILEQLVSTWSDRFLLSILHGMYEFRFRSDLSREIEYISRQSEDEMAAFNFTLDELRPLRQAHAAGISEMGDSPTPDALAALGELHEFEQDFEMARAKYQQAIRRLDEIHTELFPSLQATDWTGSGERGGKWKAGTAIQAALGSHPSGLDAVRRHMSWGIPRLRLMLQVGLTFERATNYERAAIEYRDARTLSRGLVRAMTNSLRPNVGGGVAQNDLGGRRHHVLKHLSIVFQAVFAEAWLSEKMAGGVDSSVALVEKELEVLRGMLPLVDYPREDDKASSSGFTLIMAELHNKAGDLYFFKGRQSVEHKDHPLKGNHSLGDAENGDVRQGYQLKAHEHYAMALHQVRRFISQRRQQSTAWSLARHGSSNPRETVQKYAWPDFVLRVAGSSLSDLAEATFGRSSFFGLLGATGTYQRSGSNPDGASPAEVFGDDVRKWLESVSVTLPTDSNIGHVDDWLGGWDQPLSLLSLLPPRPRFGGEPDDRQRVLFAIKTIDTAAGMLREAGYLEDAANEYLQNADTVAQLLWWANATRKIASGPDIGPGDERSSEKRGRVQAEKWIKHVKNQKTTWFPDSGCDADAFWDDAISLALDALRKSVKWFERSRAPKQHYAAGEQGHYRLGSDVPVQAAVVACSIGLAADPQRWKCKVRRAELDDLLARLTGPLWGRICGPRDEDTSALHKNLHRLVKEIYHRHPYPMLSRLHALKLSVDYGALQKERGADGDGLVEEALQLHKLAEEFSAPTHFTPFHLGFSLANAYLCSASDTSRPAADADLHGKAMAALTRSAETVTMRRGYYEAVTSLYYLYDEFNDRSIHVNHALQMAGYDVTQLLRHSLVAWGPNEARTRS